MVKPPAASPNRAYLADTMATFSHRYSQIWIAIASVIAVIFVAYWPWQNGLLVGSDGISYYMVTRSIVIDGDLDFHNEYAHFIPIAPLSIPEMPETSTGLLSNQYPIGLGLLWAPFFFLAHLAANFATAIGIPIPTDGYHPIYQASVIFGSGVFAFFGYHFTSKMAAHFYPAHAPAATLAMWAATNLSYYHLYEPSMSHMASFFAVSSMALLWVKNRLSTSLMAAIAIGAAGGLAAIIRPQDAIYLGLPLFDLATRTEDPLASRAKKVAAISLGFMAVFSLQLAVWWYIYGTPFMNGYTYIGQTFDWTSPHFFKVILSPQRGYLLWHPILLACLLGLGWFQAKQKKLAWLFALAILAQTYIVGSWFAWAQGSSFGGRMLISAYPFFTVGLCALFQTLQQKGWLVWGNLMVLFLVVWNFLFFMQFSMVFIPHQSPLSLEQITLGKVEMLATIYQRILIAIAR